MELAYEAAKVLSIAAFLFYGLSCLFSDGMVEEFERYGLSRLRRFTGLLEVAGALGLLAGYVLPGLVPAASAGLSLLMALGIATRVRLRDPLVAMLPAVALLLVNAFILLHAARQGSAAG